MSGERLKWLRVSGALIGLVGVGVSLAARYVAGSPDLPLTRTEIEYAGMGLALVGIVTVYIQQRAARKAPGDTYQKEVAQSERRLADFMVSPHLKWLLVIMFVVAVALGVAASFDGLSRLSSRRWSRPLLFGILLLMFFAAWFLHGRSRRK